MLIRHINGRNAWNPLNAGTSARRWCATVLVLSLTLAGGWRMHQDTGSDAQGAGAASVRDSARSVDVTFTGVGDFELNGTLLLPPRDGGRRLPAVVLLPGSGPTDRDGNQPPLFRTEVLKSIAERLAEEGVASLRFDKRCCTVYAPRWPKDPESINALFGWEEFSGDVHAAFEFLAAHEAIDPARIAILGHSEGGLLAIQVAHDRSDAETRPAGLILCGTAGRTLDKVIPGQVRASLQRSGLGGPRAEEIMTGLDRAIAAVRAGDPLPDDVPQALKPLFNATILDLLHAYLTVDPTILAASVAGPVLIINGADDIQVSSSLDTPALVAAFGARQGDADLVEVLIVPNTSHNLKTVEDREDAGIDGPVAPIVLERVAAWSREHLAAKGDPSPE